LVYYTLVRPKTVEFFLFDIYVTKNGMDLANLYLQNSLDYSVYQAMFDTGMRGGWKEIPANLRYSKDLSCNYNCGLTEEKIGGELLGCGDGKYGCTEGDKNAENYNDQIGKLQCILSNLEDTSGNPYYMLGIDCKFGTGTLEAVKKFQRDNGMKETGVVNETVVERLMASFLMNWDNCGDFFKNCENRGYGYWVETAKGLVPSKDDINESLKSAITENLNDYTKGGYTFLSKYYTLPTFEADNVAISDLKDKTGVFVSTDKTIRFHDVVIHETGEERIDLETYPDLGATYPLDYFALYEKSVEVFNEVKNLQCADLKKNDKPKDSVRDGNYVIDVVVTGKKNNPCEAIMKINVTDSSVKFPVRSSGDIRFEPVSMVFFMRIS